MNHRYSAVEPKRSATILNHGKLNPVPRAQLVPLRQAHLSRTKPLIQLKLKIGAANDKYEQEADRVADQVMRIPGPGVVRTGPSSPRIQRFCPECEDEIQRQMQGEFPQIAGNITPLVQRQESLEDEEEEEEVLQDGSESKEATPVQEPEEEFPLLESVDTRDADELGKEEEEDYIQPKRHTGTTPQVNPNIAGNIHSIKGQGKPLPASERAFFEPRFGRDFSHVRIHADQRAADTAEAINARAFTLGNNVVFGAGQFVPGSQLSRKLLSHELVHVIQQQGAISGARFSVPNKIQRKKHTQRTSRYVSRATAQQVIEAYLKRANAAQNKGQINPTLTVTQTIKTDLLSLVVGDIGRVLQLDSLLLTQTHLHGDPVVLARHVAKILPDKVERKRLELLGISSGTRKLTRYEKIKIALKPKPSLTSPTQRAVPVEGPTSLERFESGLSRLRESQGLSKPKTLGPYKGDVLSGIRYLRKLRTKPTRKRKPGQKFPAVEKSLPQFAKNALVPSSVYYAIRWAENMWMWATPEMEPRRLRELKAARALRLSYASPRLVARDLARSMVTGDKIVSLMLGDIYNKVQIRKAIYSELERIIRTVHSRLGNRAAHVTAVNIYFGSQLVRQVRLKP